MHVVVIRFWTEGLRLITFLLSDIGMYDVLVQSEDLNTRNIHDIERAKVKESQLKFQFFRE